MTMVVVHADGTLGWRVPDGARVITPRLLDNGFGGEIHYPNKDVGKVVPISEEAHDALTAEEQACHDASGKLITPLPVHVEADLAKLGKGAIGEIE